MRYLIFISLIWTMACGANSTERRTVSEMEDSEVAAVVGLICGTLPDKTCTTRPIVVTDSLTLQPIIGLGDCMTRLKSLAWAGSSTPSEDILDDLCSKNATPQPVWASLSSYLNITLVSTRELDAIFSSGSPQESWNRFHDRFPRSGFITLSRVGFNQARTEALVFFGFRGGPSSGEDNLYMLAMQNRAWQVKASVRTMIQ